MGSKGQENIKLLVLSTVGRVLPSLKMANMGSISNIPHGPSHTRGFKASFKFIRVKRMTRVIAEGQGKAMRQV